MPASAPPDVSVVIATFNRITLLATLLDDLDRQDTGGFEVIVVDDGSRDPVAPQLAGRPHSYPLRLLLQENAGAGAARHAGIQHAAGEIILILDDDMTVGPEFVAAHMARHCAGDEVVLGNIQLPGELLSMPLFERFHQRTLDRFVDAWRRGEPVVDGGHVCTGNVSFRRDDYNRIGGFDLSLQWCEDRDLGTRLEMDGRRMGFAEQARSVHRSDHDDVSSWRRRNTIYGESDEQISRKHSQLPKASPWAFLPRLPAVVRPLMIGAALFPWFAAPTAGLSYRAGLLFDRARRRSMAESAATLCYGLDYYRGVAAANGSIHATWGSYRAWLRLHRKEQP